MIEFEIVESDFWGYFPTKTKYTLREDVLKEFATMIALCLTDYDGKVYKRSRSVSGLVVRFGLEINEHFHTAQFTFSTPNRDDGNAAQFSAYCMKAVIDEMSAKATSTLVVEGGWVTCTVALPTLQADMLVAFVRSLEDADFAVDFAVEVSTRVYTS